MTPKNNRSADFGGMGWICPFRNYGFLAVQCCQAEAIFGLCAVKSSFAKAGGAKRGTSNLLLDFAVELARRSQTTNPGYPKKLEAGQEICLINYSDSSLEEISF